VPDKNLDSFPLMAASDYEGEYCRGATKLKPSQHDSLVTACDSIFLQKTGGQRAVAIEQPLFGKII